MKEERKAELHLAYQWDCDECGVENFCRSIKYHRTPEDEEEIRERFGIEPWEEGEFRTRPTKVVCSACGTIYQTEDD